MTANELLEKYVPVFNEHQSIDGDTDLVLTVEQARHSSFFRYWCRVWGDDERGELADLLDKEDDEDDSQ